MRPRSNTQIQSQYHRKSTGKILKGTINDAPMKIKVSSIPNRYQNIIYRQSKTPAFGNSRPRFNSVKQDELGPGVYHAQDNYMQKVFSKKGYGNLISQTKLDRLEAQRNGLPGPGTYNSDSDMRIKKSKSLALIGKTQGHQLFKNELQKSKQIPGPGLYQSSLLNSSPPSHIFNPKLQRFVGQFIQQTPPVGYYNLAQPSTTNNISYKPSASNTLQTLSTQKIQAVHQILNQKNKFKTNDYIGPGTYNTRLQDNTKTYKIKEDNYDRFGQLLKDKVEDSQQRDRQFGQSYNTSYKTMGNFNNTHSKILTSMFKSNLSRFDFVNKNINDPAKYSPIKHDKQSYLLNFTKKWV